MHWCEICNAPHSSMSCHHPAAARIHTLETQLAEQTARADLFAADKTQLITDAAIISGKFNSQIEQLESRLRAVEGLPEKWRNIVDDGSCAATYFAAADELQAALGVNHD